MTSYTYTNDSLLMSTATIDKSKLTIGYNAYYEVASKKITNASTGALLYEEDYDYDHSDDIITQTTVIKGETNSPDITNVTKTDCDGFVTYTKQNGVETTYTNDMLGNALTATTDGCTTKMEYNGVGNMTKMTKPLGGVYKYTYDTLGRKTSETLPNGGTTTYEYDNLDRLILEKSPITNNNTKSEKSYTYDKNGNVLTEKIKTNAVGSSTATYSTTNYSYDEKNNLKRVQNVDNNGKVCYTEYDGVGNLLKSKAANGQNVTTYEYNSLNRVTKMTDPMGKSETYTYDISGNMIQKVDRNKTTLVYEYDPMNRLTMERAKVGNDYVLKGYYAYTLTGNLKISQGYYNRFVMTYDEYGRLRNTEIKQGENYFKYYYNYMNNNRGLVSNKYLYKYSDGYFDGKSELYAEHKYTYDSENNITKIETRGKENPIDYKDLVSYTYDKVGNITKEVKGNVTTDYTYNLGNLVTNMTNKNGQSVISTYNYSYNYDGNISKSVENGVTKNYKYDPMNRLVQENTKNNTYSYTYDNAGNRATLTATGSENYVKSYIYDKNNRLLEECKAVNNDKYITSYQYDNNGNTIERVKSEVHLNNTSRDSLSIKTKAELPKAYSREYFKYNVFNQLSTYYSTANGKYATYKYLSNGYRCYKKVSGVETDFVWDGDEIGAEYDENGNVTNVLFRGNNLVRDSKGNNYVYDSHGSVTSILNNNGSKSKEYEYDAFGNIEKETNASTYNPWQYCGEYTDQESGFIYLRNRYYDSETGRFINEDPARSGGNWYSYCSGNPIMFWDKMGLEYNSLRNLTDSVEKALDTKATISVYKDNVTIGFYEDGYNYRGTFKYDGTAIIDGTKRKIADNRDGYLYMERTSFYDVMGIKNEQYNAPIEEYTNFDAIFDTFKNKAKSTAISFFVGIYGLAGSFVITGAETASELRSKIDDRYKVKTVGFYYDESVVGEVYNSKTNKYESICTYTTYQLANNKNQIKNWNFFVSYTENFGVGYQTSIF